LPGVCIYREPEEERITMAREISDNKIKYRPKPGSLIPFDEKIKEYKGITGDPEIVRKAWENIEKAWENIEEYATRFVWMCLTDI
jgi:hypothetical protein